MDLTLAPNPAAVPSQDDGAFDLRRLFQIAMRWKWLIAGVAALSVGASGLEALSRVPMFRAEATLEVQAQESRILETGEIAPNTYADYDYMGTQYELLRSRALSERVAETLKLHQNSAYADQQADAKSRLAQATQSVASGIKIAPVPSSRIIKVQIVNPSAEDAARIANAVADSFIEMTLERRYNTTAYARTFLEERLAQAKTALEQAERKLVEYSKDKQIVDLSSVGGSEIGSSLDASSLVALSAALTEAQSARVTAELKYKEALVSDASREVLDSDALRALKKVRSELNAEYQERLSRFKPDFPDMMELQSRIRAIELEMSHEKDAILKVLEAEYKEAASGEIELRKRVEELKFQVQDLRSRSIDYNILARDVDTQRTQYEALLQRSKEVGVTSGIGASQVSVVDRAEPPSGAFEPNLRSSLFKGLLLGVVLGLGLAFLIDYIDDTIKTPEDVKRKLHLPVIGVAPRLRGKVDLSAELLNPRSVLAEAFSSARTALQFSSPSGAPQTLLVTGAKPGEGKTSASLALGYSFAGIGKSVLIIDGDMRRPSFQADPEASIGLSGMLTRNTPLSDQIVKGPIPNIFLLPAGTIPPNPAELLSGGRVHNLLEEARSMFDIVVIDSPPVLDFADAPALSAHCDATLLALQSGGVRTPAARRAVERLVAANANLVGVLLTKFNAQHAGDGYADIYTYGNAYRTYGQVRAMSRRGIGVFNQKPRFPMDDAAE